MRCTRVGSGICLRSFGEKKPIRGVVRKGSQTLMGQHAEEKPGVLSREHLSAASRKVRARYPKSPPYYSKWLDFAGRGLFAEQGRAIFDGVLRWKINDQRYERESADSLELYRDGPGSLHP